MNSLRGFVTSTSVISRLLQGKSCNISVRFLYNEQFLGLDKYVEGRQRTISRIGNMRENFYNRMRAQLNTSQQSMIFTEDLKTIIHSAEDKPEDLELTVQMMKRFHKQNKELRFGTFIFGPVAMRLFYFLKKQDMMCEFFKDPELDGFFDQLKSYLLCMDLCFKNGEYDQILGFFKDMQNKQIAETKFPREAVVLTVGACYKLNTPETFQLATDIVTQAREAKVPVIRKALSFVVALALNQGRPDVALEILSSIDRYNNITGNNLKLLALAGLDRINDAFDILRRVTDQDSPVQARIRGEICQSTLDALQKSVDKLNDKETSHIFEQLCRSLKESNSVTNQTIDDLVCQPIEFRQFLRDDSFSFRPRNRFPEQQFRPRERESLDRDTDFPI
ncbi:Pentatricopeptide repeat-containing protein 2, partial [Stegodyphus mimosarum]